MKDKIILFIIGVLVGAIISTSAFYVYTKVTTTCNTNNNQTQIPGANPPSMSEEHQNGQPPEIPNGNNSQNNNRSSSN